MTDNIENNEAQEKPVVMTAADMLRNARTTGRRKREIQTISKQLCIREEFLEALESGNYSQIPEPVYILGFARNYAIELGLDPDEIVAKIKQEMGASANCSGATDDADTSACAMPSIKEESWYKLMFVKAYQFVYQNWIWFLGGLVGLVIIILGVVLLSGGDDTEALSKVAETNTQVENVVAVVDDKEPAYKHDVRERFGMDNREKANVILQATQESWVKVEDGRGKTVFSRVLVPGDVYYVPAGNKYKATFGNAGGIDIWVDGQLIPDVGANHMRVAGISLSPENLLKAGKK